MFYLTHMHKNKHAQVEMTWMNDSMCTMTEMTICLKLSLYAAYHLKLGTSYYFL